MMPVEVSLIVLFTIVFGYFVNSRLKSQRKAEEDKEMPKGA